MVLLLFLLFMVAIPAAVAAAAAGLLSVRKTQWRTSRRTTLAAALAGLVPVTLPIVSVMRGNDGGVGPVVPTVALLLLGLVMATVIGVPVALWIGKRKTPLPVPPRVFD